jgi:F-type H+-transporting ATPase subunit delta
MTNRKAARRYNSALFEIASEQKLVDAVKKDFEDIKKSIAGSKELAGFLVTPIINLNKKAEVIKSVFSGKLNDLTLKFLEVLCKKNRINIINDIIEDFLNLVNDKRGVITAKIKTAVEISGNEKSALTEKLKKYTGKDITALYSVDPSIKGGFIAQIEDKIIDASILRQLELLREKFAQGSFNN